MFQQQPMKMAAAEALCTTEKPAGFSVFAVGDVSTPDCEGVKSVTLPRLLSYLATGNFTDEVKGVDQLLPQYQQRYGATYPDDPKLGDLAGKPVDYVPNLPVTYWSFRLMIGFGVLAVLVSIAALWLTRRGRAPDGPWFGRLSLVAIAAPFLGNAFGWIFTEMGRQPFVVVPNPNGVDGLWMYTAQGVSGLGVGEVLTSLLVLSAVYGVLAVVEFMLIRRYVRAGLPTVDGDSDDDTTTIGPPADEDRLTFAY